MPANWRKVELDTRLFQNLRETVLTKAQAALENAWINEAGGHTRFPGIKPFIDLGDMGRVYMSEWRGDLIAATERGRVFRIGRTGKWVDITGEPLQGGHRVVFDQSETELLMADGGPIIRLNEGKTTKLSEDAPNSTHVATIDGYVVAIEANSQRFQHSRPGQSTVWDALDVFAAEGTADNLNATIVTPFRELLMCGDKSIEQFERLPNGDRPFIRRWATGEGLQLPYTLIAADNGNFGVNDDSEIVRFSGQASQPISDDVQASVEEIDDRTDAWAVRVNIAGQAFLIFQFPQATNVYGTKGVTFLYDLRSQKFSSLFGWDETLGLPTRWPGWSIYRLWDRVFVGSGDGKIGELDRFTTTNFGAPQRMYGRTAHISKWGEAAIRNTRWRVVRGDGGNNGVDPVINLRFLKDNRRWTRWIRKSLGKQGDRDMMIRTGPIGNCFTLQAEYFVTDNVPVDIVGLQADVGSLNG